LLATASGRLGKESEARVYLAEEALLQNRVPEAQSMAEQALNTLSPSSPLRIRAEDVISLSKSIKDRKEQ
jgi:predicted Zn-dependent protease